MKMYDSTEYKGEFNLKVMERSYIKEAFRRSNGKFKDASKLLNITERTLFNKIKKHNINPKDYH